MRRKRASHLLVPSAVAPVALLTAGLVAGGTIGGGGEREMPALPGSPGEETGREVFAPYAPTCEPGPASVWDFGAGPGGYPRYEARGEPQYYEFHFARAVYRDFRRRFGGMLGDGGPAWSIDYPDADRHMVLVAARLSNLDACRWERPVSLADPELRRFPFLYSLEWGYADLSEDEVEGLRGFLEAGGLLMIDDFWGSREWANFERQIQRVLPGREIVDIPMDHLLFRIHYTIDEVIQVPNAYNGRAVGMGFPGATTSEQDGYVAHVRGIFDEAGRLMVVINWNTDLGDALEWADNPFYPLQYSRFASELFLNIIIYSMTQ